MCKNLNFIFDSNFSKSFQICQRKFFTVRLLEFSIFGPETRRVGNCRIRIAQVENPKIVMSKGREFFCWILNHLLFNREAATPITTFSVWKLEELLKQGIGNCWSFPPKIGSSRSRTVLVKIENLKIADLMDAGRECLVKWARLFSTIGRSACRPIGSSPSISILFQVGRVIVNEFQTHREKSMICGPKNWPAKLQLQIRSKSARI